MSAVFAGRRRAGGAPQLWPLAPRTRPATAPLSETTSIVSTSMTVLAIVVVWFLAQVLLLGGIEQGRAQDRLYLDFRTQLASAEAPTGGVITPGAPVALLSIPAIGLQQVVAEGTSSGVLIHGPGHRRDTVLPGQAGVSIVYGRSSTYGRPFAAMLGDARGRWMTVVTGQGETTYRIGAVRRAGDPMSPLPAAGGSRITVVTSDGTGGLGALSAGDVVYVDADIVGKPFTAPAGRPNTISRTESAMAADTTVLPSLALALGTLALATVGAIWARQRFGFVRTWVVATPVVLALAWLTSDLATYLLPNLL